MTEAEKEKLEAADRARRDAARDLGEDKNETTEGKPRADEGVGEEIPAWADSHKKAIDAIMDRLDSMEKDRKDALDKPGGEVRRPPEAADRADVTPPEQAAGERAAGAEEEKRKLEEEERRKREDALRGDGAGERDREDRARRDAQVFSQNRKLQAEVDELKSRMRDVYREPSIEDRAAIADVRSRADSLYQALTGQPASSPIPGESPISYRKRMADGLRRFSDKMKDVRVDSLTGEAFAVIEDRIYTDAQAAIKSEAIVPAGTLRPITRNDSGHIRTDYVGDTAATWAPFQAGAVRRMKLINPKAAH